jgi:hypothetical protein
MGKLLDLTGQKFGKWTVLKIDSKIRGKYKYLCQCDCGNISSIYGMNLKRKLSTKCRDCASLNYSRQFLGLRLNNREMIGKKFNHIEVLGFEKIDDHVKAKVKCDCGNIAYIPNRIRNGIYQTCGKCNLRRRNYKSVKRILTLGNERHYLKIIKEISPKLAIAKCKCGKELEVKIHHMLTQYPSCGCYWKNIHIENAKKLVGYKFGRLKVIKFLGMKGEKSRASYLLKCNCGEKLEKSISNLFQSQSCGCLQKENTPKGSRQFLSKLTENEVCAMRDLFKTGLYKKKDLAHIFSVSPSTAGNMINAKTWKHL